MLILSSTIIALQPPTLFAQEYRQNSQTLDRTRKRQNKEETEQEKGRTRNRQNKRKTEKGKQNRR